jgi:hypothetical protein
VTRVTVKTARCGARRVALPLMGGLIALFLAACETGSSSSGSTPTASLTAAPQQVQSKPISFAPVIGAPGKISSKMNELLVASAGQKNIPVVASKEADYTVRGYLVAAADPQGTKLSYIWDITDKSGKRAKRLQGDELIQGKKGGDPWALVDDAAMERVAARTTEDLVAWMPGGVPSSTASTQDNTQQTAQASEPRAEQPRISSQEASANVLAAQTQPTASESRSAPAGPAIAVVPPVTGAPGDGQNSLTEAMRRHLKQAGVKVAEESDPTAYTVRGTVQLGNADSGQQPITIRWLVVDPEGKTMEKAVVQRNKVPEGSLDGSWGQVADLAAGEAARSIAKLIKPAG